MQLGTCSNCEIFSASDRLAEEFYVTNKNGGRIYARIKNKWSVQTL